MLNLSRMCRRQIASRYRKLLRFTLALDAGTRVLQRHAKIVVAAHLDAQVIEVRLGRLDRWGFLAIEERDLDRRQIVGIGEQVPGLRRVAGVLGIGEIPTYFDAVLALVRVGNGEL